MKRALPSLALAITVALLASTGAHASETPRFESLVESKLPTTTTPADAPKSIRASEHLKDFEVKLQDTGGASSAKSRRRAKAARSKGGRIEIEGTTHAGEENACLGQLDGDALRNHSPLAAADRSTLYLVEGEVALIDREALDLSDAARPALAITTAWIDTKTLGMKPIESRRVPLVRLAGGPGHTDVFAAREGNRVMIVVRNPEQQMLAPSSSCGHVRAELSVDKVGDGAMTSFVRSIDLDLGEPSKKEERKTADDDDPLPLEIRSRTLRVNASLSWLSRDKLPVLGLSFGFLDRGHARSDGGA